jgi:hypothetical protein
MIVFDPGAGEPLRWHVCFSRRAATPWMACLPIGTYKHVRAFGCVTAINTWIFFDPALDRTAIKIARGDAVRALMLEWLADADVVTMPAATRTRMVPRLGGWCVPQVKALLGLRSGALRPDALFDDCLRHGGEILENGRAELQPVAG